MNADSWLVHRPVMRRLTLSGHHGQWGSALDSETRIRRRHSLSGTRDFRYQTGSTSSSCEWLPVTRWSVSWVLLPSRWPPAMIHSVSSLSRQYVKSQGISFVRFITLISVLSSTHNWNKKLSCCCDSRSYCVWYTVYWQTIKPVRSDSADRNYERTQTQSTQAWLTKVHEVSE